MFYYISNTNTSSMLTKPDHIELHIENYIYSTKQLTRKKTLFCVCPTSTFCCSSAWMCNKFHFIVIIGNFRIKLVKCAVTMQHKKNCSLSLIYCKHFIFDLESKSTSRNWIFFFAGLYESVKIITQCGFLDNKGSLLYVPVHIII